MTLLGVHTTGAELSDQWLRSFEPLVLRHAQPVSFTGVTDKAQLRMAEALVNHGRFRQAESPHIFSGTGGSLDSDGLFPARTPPAQNC